MRSGSGRSSSARASANGYAASSAAACSLSVTTGARLEAAARGSVRESLSQIDGDDEQEDQECRDHVDDRRLGRAEQVVEDPQRQRLHAGSGGERGDDDLVEAQGEGQE